MVGKTDRENRYMDIFKIDGPVRLSGSVRVNGSKNASLPIMAASILAPVATAMFANSSRIDGADSGYRSYRHAIWRETDDDRCGLPSAVFEDGFEIEHHLDHGNRDRG